MAVAKVCSRQREEAGTFGKVNNDPPPPLRNSGSFFLIYPAQRRCGLTSAALSLTLPNGRTHSCRASGLRKSAMKESHVLPPNRHSPTLVATGPLQRFS